ncbi:MAG: cell division protein FtsA [Desulfovibrio sp.]|jgi:cell division protein FtsA|nr:cell division protein FtsA [Desulfovibrio sp.]
MSNSELIVGLDIGTTKVCAVVGEVTAKGDVEIVGIGNSESPGLLQGRITNVEQTVNAIRKAVEEAERAAGCSIHAVFTGITGLHIEGRNNEATIVLKNREVTRNDMERVLENAKAIVLPQEKKILHALPQEYAVDDMWGITDPLSLTGVKLQVRIHVVAGSSSVCQNIETTCDRAGLAVDGMALESLVSAEAVLSPQEKEIGVAVVDIGGGTSDIIVYVQGAVRFTSVVSLGGQKVTDDISWVLRTSKETAEKIKVMYGHALKEMVNGDEGIEVPIVGEDSGSRDLSKLMLAEICEPRMEEILKFVDRELEKSGFKRKLGAGVVLTGGGSMIEGCAELARDVFNLNARIGRPRETGALKDMVSSPKFATAVGLLRYGASVLQSQNEEWAGGAREKQSREPKKAPKGLGARLKDWFFDVT